MKPELILALISLVLEKGLPTYIKWQDGVSLTDPTLDDFENLKVKGMRDKLNSKELER